MEVTEASTSRTSSGQNDAERCALAEMSIYLHLPPCAVTMARTRLRPSPSPELAGDVTAIEALPDVTTCSGAIPGPVSVTVIVTGNKARSYVRRSVLR
jgi:hypothetical protein